MTLDEAVELITGEGASKKERDTLESITDEQLEAYNPLRQGGVDKTQCVGYMVRSPYHIFSPKELVSHFGSQAGQLLKKEKGKGKQQLKLVSATIKNEQMKKEQVILVIAYYKSNQVIR